MAYEWTEEARAAVSRFGAWLEASDTSRREAAKRLRISEATLSQMLSCTYAGRVDEIVVKMDRVLDDEDLRATAPTPPPYATTSVSEDVIETLRTAHIERLLALLMGPTGVGKTVGCRRYREARTDTVLVTAGTDASTHAICRLLCDELGIDWPGQIHRARHRIAEDLRGSGRLIIVDECDYMAESALQCLRMIQDAAEIGMVWVGTPALLDRIRGWKSGTKNQITGRIKCPRNVGLCSLDDVAAILKPMGLRADIVDLIAESAHGQARHAVALALSAKRLAGAGEVTDRVIRAATRTLMPVEVG